MTKQTITIQPFSLRGSKNGNLTLQYYMIFDKDTKRFITITGPYKDFKEKLNIPGRMNNIINILIRRSGYTTEMTYSDFLNFEFKNFHNLIIKNVLI